MIPAKLVKQWFLDYANDSAAQPSAWGDYLANRAAAWAFEQAAKACDEYDNGDYAADQWYCADMIRAIASKEIDNSNSERG